MSSTPWRNADGLDVKGPDYFKSVANFTNKARFVRKEGIVKQAIFDYDLSLIASGAVSYTCDANNDGTADCFNTGDFYLPANSSVIRVTLVTKTAAAGGTSFVLGTYLIDGTAVSANSLITATEGVLANIDSVGSRTFGAGALVSSSVETAGVGTADAFIGIKPTGTFTTGTGRILIEYIDPLVDA